MKRYTRTTAVALASLTALIAVIGATASTQKRQRIAIQEAARSTGKSGTGTFTLTPLTPGPLKRDTGTYTFTVKISLTVIRGGQRSTTYTGVDELQGKRGTLRIPNVILGSRAGGGYQIGAATWSVKRGTKAYAGIAGGGRGGFVLTPRGFVFSRYEGFVTTP
jgi:hypothetical protein